MATFRKTRATRDLLTLFNVGTIRDLTDGQLLERFATLSGEAAELAFAAIVERHGPMVLRVCGASLGDANDAHDAFQAVFLVLVRKAPGLWVEVSLGPWLHAVACRTAQRMRANAMRRQRLERVAAVPVEAATRERPMDFQAIHDEINRLPDRYRAPVILCDLEGCTHEQAARHLGLPIGTVKSRQSRGRDRLRARLTRRGLALGLVLPIAPNMPQTLIDATSRLALQAASTRVLAATTTTILAREVIRTMFLIRMMKATAAVLFAAGTLTGAGISARSLVAGTPQDAAKKADDVATIQVKVGREARVIAERGSLEATERVDGINQVEGVTTIISLLPEGTRVKEGDLVCELDSSTFRDQLVNQEMATKQAFAKLANAEKLLTVAQIRVNEYAEGTFPNNRAELEDAVSIGMAEIELVESRHDRAKKLQQDIERAIQAKGDAVSPAELVTQFDLIDRVETLRLEVLRKNRSLKRAKERLYILETFTKLRTETELQAEVVGKEASVRAAEADYKLAKAREDHLREQIDRCKIYAKTTGLLIYATDPLPGSPLKVSIEEGAQVRERQKLFSIVDLGGPMRVDTKIPESLVDFVFRGQKASVKVDALPGKTFEGVVKAVSPLPDPIGFANSGAKAYTTLVELTTGDAQLRPGMTAEVGIQTPDMLEIPSTATYEVGGTRYVAVKTPGGNFEPRKLNAKYGIPGKWFVEPSDDPGTIRKGDAIAADPKPLLEGEQGERLRKPQAR